MPVDRGLTLDAVCVEVASLSKDSATESRMSMVCDALWRACGSRELGAKGWSWVGFYFGPGRSMHWPGGVSRVVGSDEMLLGPSRDTPACSPIGLHGVCGAAFRGGSSIVVRDVASLGDAYVACDPRDASELVVPLFDDGGEAYGVFDADSFDVGAFSASDAVAVERVLAAAGLTSVASPTRVEVR
jgi:putative methionine-R-sulfoxide reductase with GAF domain